MIKLLTLFLLVHNSQCFYVPGVAPYEFKEGENVEVKAVKMNSVKTQIPYEYYTLPFCEPKQKHYVPENLGEILRGDRIVNTPYLLQMNKQSSCSMLCAKKKLTVEQSALIAKRIKEDYSVHMIIDNLPAATKYVFPDGKIQFDHGWELGKNVNGKVQMNNHLKIVVNYNKDSAKNLYRVVGFEVYPASISNVQPGEKNQCTFPTKPEPLIVNENAETDVLFTYEVSWAPSEIRWASRWDNYLKMKNVQIHWFSIINSIVIVMFLSGILAMIIIRTLRRDIANYNRDDDIEDTIEETGWKLVHGDVFRPPRYPMLLSALIGSGVQLFCMVLITIVFAMLGMLSPASRGSLLSAVIFLYVFMGCFL